MAFWTRHFEVPLWGSTHGLIRPNGRGNSGCADACDVAGTGLGRAAGKIHRARCESPSFDPGRARLLARRARSRYHARIRLYLLLARSRKGRPGAHRQAGELCTAAAVAEHNYPGGPSELNATCKAYFALKLAGDSTNTPHMTQARETAHRLGGLEHTNSYVRFYLALVGAVGWELVPSIPPELMLLPHWCYFNIYEMS